jgi:hypothetical protein
MQHLLGCMRRTVEQAAYEELSSTMPNFEWHESMPSKPWVLVTYGSKHHEFFSSYWRCYTNHGGGTWVQLDMSEESRLCISRRGKFARMSLEPGPFIFIEIGRAGLQIVLQRLAALDVPKLVSYNSFCKQPHFCLIKAEMQQLVGCISQVKVHKELSYLLPIFNLSVYSVGTGTFLEMRTPRGNIMSTQVNANWRNGENLGNETMLSTPYMKIMRFVRVGDHVRFIMCKDGIESDYGPVALAMVIVRIRALDVPQLPESSRVALRNFLADSARLL